MSSDLVLHSSSAGGGGEQGGRACNCILLPDKCRVAATDPRPSSRRSRRALRSQQPTRFRPSRHRSQTRRAVRRRPCAAGNRPAAPGSKSRTPTSRRCRWCRPWPDRFEMSGIQRQRRRLKGLPTLRWLNGNVSAGHHHRRFGRLFFEYATAARTWSRPCAHGAGLLMIGGQNSLRPRRLGEDVTLATHCCP